MTHDYYLFEPDDSLFSIENYARRQIFAFDFWKISGIFGLSFVSLWLKMFAHFLVLKTDS